MRIEIIAETTEETLQIRALEARALELGVTLTEVYRPWTIDQVGAAVGRLPLSEATVQAAESRAQAAATDERARLETERLAVTTQE